MNPFNIIASYKKSITFICGWVIASEVLWYFFKQYISSQQRKKRIQLTSPIAEVFFFTDESAACRTHANYNVPCDLPNCPVGHVKKLMDYLSCASSTLDICVYFLTFNGIVKTLIELHKRNVDIRVITDDETADNGASQNLNMRKAGIKVRSKKFQYLMHHKFAIIDKKLLITGSANWTIQAFLGNYENILVINEEKLVDCYVKEFDKLWNKYDYSPEVETTKKN